MRGASRSHTASCRPGFNSGYCRWRHSGRARRVAALTLGASAAAIGTGFLRAPEAQLNPAWAGALAGAEADATVLTRAYSGRLGRCVKNAYVEAALPKRPHLGAARGGQENARQASDTGMGGTIRRACPRGTSRGNFAPHLARGGFSFGLEFSRRFSLAGQCPRA
jgi:NAD(P)H-dependent flavin oxidoreductase YrpB (nitropropane dioxygenase family)